MRLRSAMNAAAYGISTAALAFGLSTGALAQTTAPKHGCQPKAQVEAVIASGGYKAIVVGNRADGVGNANIFFANKEGYGFSAEGDRPLGTPTVAQICVTDHYKEVRVNDPRNPNIPVWLTIKSGAGKDYTDFAQGYQNGSRIIFTAQSFTTAANGTEKIGKTMAIFATPDKTATLEHIDPRGFSQASVVLRNVALTGTANAFVVPDSSVATVAQAGIVQTSTVAPR